MQKGIVGEGLLNKIYVGDFKNLENEFMNSREENRFERFNEQRENLVKKQINQIKISLNSLDKTILSMKREVQSEFDGSSYSVWSKRIYAISSRFKTMFSDINNDLYNHLYRTSKKAEISWKNISNDIQRLNDNMHPNLTKSNACTSCDKAQNSNHGLPASTTKNSKVNVEEEFQRGDDFLKGIDLQKLFSETCGNAFNNKRSPIEPLANENRKKMKPTTDDGFETISDNEFSEGESTMINGMLLIDEVGSVDMDDFNDLINRVAK